MTESVIISVEGTQKFIGEEKQVVQIVTDGTMKTEGDTVYLSYEESEMTGMEGTTTTFEVKGPRVILTRSGTVNSQMVFEEGRQHTSLYETPFGELSVDIQTSVLKHNLTERGGVMEIQYSIAVEHTVTGRNCFKIRVKRKH